MGGTSIKTAHLNMLASIIVTTCCSQQQLEYQTLALKIGHPTSAEWQKFTKIVGKLRQLCLLWKWSEQHSNTWQQRALIFKVVTFILTWTETVLIKFSTTTEESESWSKDAALNSNRYIITSLAAAAPVKFQGKGLNHRELLIVKDFFTAHIKG